MTSLGPGFDTLLTRGALGALAAVGAWVVLVVLSVALEARTAGRIRLARTGCPPAVRRWLLGLFLVCFAGVAAPAAASGSGTGPGSGAGSGSGDAESTVATALDGLPLPDRTVGGRLSRTPDETGRIVQVRAGDSLWSIARDRLPEGAANAEIAAVVRRLYAVNRRTIGADPDLIVPGQRLQVGPPTTPSHRHHLGRTDDSE